VEAEARWCGGTRIDEDEQYAMRKMKKMNSTCFTVSFLLFLFFRDRDQLQSDGGELFMHHA
jgi:hypothetical protein